MTDKSKQLHLDPEKVLRLQFFQKTTFGIGLTIVGVFLFLWAVNVIFKGVSDQVIFDLLPSVGGLFCFFISLSIYFRCTIDSMLKESMLFHSLGKSFEKIEKSFFSPSLKNRIKFTRIIQSVARFFLFCCLALIVLTIVVYSILPNPLPLQFPYSSVMVKICIASQVYLFMWNMARESAFNKLKAN